MTQDLPALTVLSFSIIPPESIFKVTLLHRSLKLLFNLVQLYFEKPKYSASRSQPDTPVVRKKSNTHNNQRKEDGWAVLLHTDP